ncbi:MAG: hypothetical protein QNJ45_10050 [Ardenticatenaceae bacterium]|nr:hypothetical protein [Ardenticatenaceae bacterium]
MFNNNNDIYLDLVKSVQARHRRARGSQRESNNHNRFGQMIGYAIVIVAPLAIFLVV